MGLDGGIWTSLTVQSLPDGGCSYFPGLACKLLSLEMPSVCLGMSVYTCAACELPLLVNVNLTIHSGSPQVVPCGL